MKMFAVLTIWVLGIAWGHEAAVSSECTQSLIEDHVTCGRRPEAERRARSIACGQLKAAQNEFDLAVQQISAARLEIHKQPWETKRLNADAAISNLRSQYRTQWGIDLQCDAK